MWTIILTALVAGASAIPTPNSHVVHEKRSSWGSSRYSRSLRLEGDSVVPVRIALKQSNLDRGYGHLMEISRPSSKNYGKHWTAKEVAQEFGPSSQSIDSVLNWLKQAGIEDARQIRNGEWISFDASASQVEALFTTELHEYEDGQDGSIRVGSDEYSLPAHLVSHIDYITPGVQLSPPISKSKVKRGLTAGGSRSDGRLGFHTLLDSSSGNPTGNLTGQIQADLGSCGKNITPPCVEALYGLPAPQANLSAGILGIFEQEDTYSQENLDQYFQAFAPYIPLGTSPNLVSINGGIAPVPTNSTDNTGESDIDFDIAFSLLGDVPITLYQTINPGNTTASMGSVIVDPLLAAVDAAYCDATESGAGYDCGTVSSLTSVVSMSYGLGEAMESFVAQDRACNEFMKLSLQGHTFVVSSGDYGVGQNPANAPSGDACSWNGCLVRDVSDNVTDTLQVFNPSFPASCPYVLSVGATQIEDDETVNDPEHVMYQPTIGAQVEADCTNPTAFFSSGGGFSNYFSQPSYQSSAVEGYFAHHNPGYYPYNLTSGNITSLPSSGVFNIGGRGIPDVSANGAKMIAFLGDSEGRHYGTSLSAPIWASIIAMINQARLDAGKGPVGFINPALYENPDVFNDITIGSNPGCGTHGFDAATGWDPVTGLGTPVFDKLMNLFMSLQ